MLQQLNTPKPRGLKQRLNLKTLPSATPKTGNNLQRKLLHQTAVVKKSFKVYEEEQEICHSNTEDNLNWNPEEEIHFDNQKIYPRFNFMNKQERQVLDEINSGRIDFLDINLSEDLVQNPIQHDLDFRFDEKEFSNLF